MNKVRLYVNGKLVSWTQRICKKCKRFLGIREILYCRKCAKFLISKRTKEWAINNKERHNNRGREYYASHPNYKLWQLKNHKKLFDNNQEIREGNKLRCKVWNDPNRFNIGDYI